MSATQSMTPGMGAGNASPVVDDHASPRRESSELNPNGKRASDSPEDGPSLSASPEGNKENKKPKLTKEEREAERARKEMERKRKREEEEERRRRKKEEEEERRRKRKTEEEERKKRREEEEERKRKKREEEEERRRKKKEEEEQKRKDREQERELKRKQKEEEKRQKEEEKRQKEEEKQRKLEEKRQKEEKAKKAQPSIASFFTKTDKNPLLADTPPKAEASAEQKSSPAANDFERCFLPFHIKTHTTLVPLHSFGGPGDAPADVDRALRGESGGQDCLAWLKSRRVKRGFEPTLTTAAVISIVNSPSTQECEVIEKLRSLPYKHIQFNEDIRPAYVGTFSKGCAFARDPTSRHISTINYDYDSEIEWMQDEDEEGEDIGDEDNSEDEGDSDDMSDFLDSDEGSTRRQIVGSLQPISKWNDGTDLEFFAPMQIEFLVDRATGQQIDPFHDYWAVPKQPTMLGQEPSRPTVNTASPALVPDTILKDFLSKVEGSDMNQTLLFETLCRDFPSVKRGVVKQTLKKCASRDREKKRWVVNQEYRIHVTQT